MSDENTNGGGEHGVTHIEIDTVALTYNRATDHLDVGGTCASVDLMLDMLGRARRALEFQLRKTQALEIQAAALRAAEDARIAAALRKGK